MSKQRETADNQKQKWEPKDEQWEQETEHITSALKEAPLSYSFYWSHCVTDENYSQLSLN